MSSRKAETFAFHFDLNHCPPDQEFTLCAGGKHRSLTRHTQGTLNDHAAKNKALGLMPAEHQQRFTHFIEAVELPADAVSMFTVTYPSKNPGGLLPELALVYIYIPTEVKRRFYRRKKIASSVAAAGKETVVIHVPPVLAQYGIDNLPDEGLEDLLFDATLLATPISVAQKIILDHPDLKSLNPDITQEILEDYINRVLAIDKSLQSYISTHGPDSAAPYYTQTVAQEPNGTIMAPNPEVVAMDGPINWPQQNGQSVMPIYKLSDGVVGVGDLPGIATPVVQKVLKLVKQALSLNGQIWTVQNGTTVKHQSQLSPRRRIEQAAETGPRYKWAITNTTSHYGVNLDEGSLSFNESTKHLSFKVKNWANRCLSVYVQFLDEAGNPIDNPNDWDEKLPESLQGLFERDQSKKYLTYLDPGNVLAGIPIWTDWTELEFPFPDNAASANVLLGGIGIGDFDGDADIPGMILTILFNYGIPGFMLGLGIGMPAARYFARTLEDTAISIAIYSVGAFLAAPEIILTALNNPKKLLGMAGEFAVGIIFGQGLTKLTMKITGYVTATEIIDKTPFIGWALQVAGCVATIADVIATTVEVLKSPYTYNLLATRAMDVEVKLFPDVTHNRWPLGADNWEMTLQYKKGNAFKNTGKGPDPAAPSLITSWKDVSAAPDDQFQVIASLYARDDTLCGLWVSDWIVATPPENDSTLSLEGHIIEQLHPLTAKTQYEHIQKLIYNSEQRRYEWLQTTIPPRQVWADTDCGGNHNLCEWVNLTINNQAYQLGYTYRASGQNLPGTVDPNGQLYAFQNISTQADPQTNFKEPTLGFAGKTYLCYDQFGPTPLFSVASQQYQPELDNAQISEALSNVFATAGIPSGNNYTLPQDAAVTVVIETAEWYIGPAGQAPVYDLRRVTDTILVFYYPSPAFSARNFYLDPRAETPGKYYLRGVALDDNSPTFNYSPGKSWGTFAHNNLWALVVHPNGYVIGVSYEDNKMEILQLPDGPVDDAKAQPALPVSGEGIREGLMMGPVALTITPDGRILVLEHNNARIQAFDIRGNPVQCFAGPVKFTLSSDFIEDLNSNNFSSPFIQAYQMQMAPSLAPLAYLPQTFVADLDSGRVPPEMITMLADYGIDLSSTLELLVTKQGEVWLLIDQSNNLAYDIRNNLSMYELEFFNGPTFSSQIKAVGSQWALQDNTNTCSFEINLGSTAVLDCEQRISYMGLKDPATANVTYLDIGVELKSYIYVLSYTGGGTSPSDYRLDIYNPDGTWLTRTPKDPASGGVNAARFVVDQWRSVWTLNYEAIYGSGGRTQPSVSAWIPQETAKTE